MLDNKHLVCIGMFFILSLFSPIHYAQGDGDGVGQTIQIHTRFHSFVGKPTWLFVIRDLDHNQSIPYFYEIKRGDNFWVAFTYSRNYVISVSNLQIETYQSRYNKYKNYKTSNFCHLESNGRIMRGESIYIDISGKLSPNSNTYTCHVSHFRDANFNIANPN